MCIICSINLFLVVSAQIILIAVKNRMHLGFSKKEDIDCTEDGLPSVFHLLGFISVFFYSFNSHASFL